MKFIGGRRTRLPPPPPPPPPRDAIGDFLGFCVGGGEEGGEGLDGWLAWVRSIGVEEVAVERLRG